MAISELQTWIMHQLGASNGLIEGLPSRPGIDAEAMEQAIDGLVRLRYVTVVGPPNANSYMGKDVDELRIMPFGAGFLRTFR